MFPVSIEPPTSGQAGIPDPREWTCCMDCGVLMTRSRGGRPWSICKSCSTVYTSIKHPWLARMLAKRLGNADRIASKLKRYRHKRYVFKCVRCNRYYLDIENKHHHGQICHWCFLENRHPPTQRELLRCGMCGKPLAQTSRQFGFCTSCETKIIVVHRALEYMNLIQWHARYGEGREVVHGSKGKKVGSPIGLREDIKKFK